MSKTVPQSKAGSSQAGETDILYTAQGKLSLKDAFSYDVPKVSRKIQHMPSRSLSKGPNNKTLISGW